ncbi:MAG: TatD family hydrolase, partial [Candidatus Hydrogenedentota bacterium]
FIELALSLELPIIIHSRESDKRMHEILKSHFDGSKLYGVWHCFSGDKKLAFKVIDNGFVLGFCGNITYKNSSDTVSVIKNIPLEFMLLETDSPYLTPQKHRGKLNEPSFVCEIYNFVCESRGMSLEILKQNLYNNFVSLFKISE